MTRSQPIPVEDRPSEPAAAAPPAVTETALVAAGDAEEPSVATRRFLNVSAAVSTARGFLRTLSPDALKLAASG